MSGPGAHPLAHALVRCLLGGGRVLVVGAGSGRSLPPLIGAGHAVDALDDSPERVAALRTRFAGRDDVRIAHASVTEPATLGRGYGGALATNAYLHGTFAKIASALAQLRLVLAPGAIIACTLGSVGDPRYGTGQRIDDETWAPLEGPEIGVPHVFVDADGARELLTGFTILSLVEHEVAGIVGEWAHDGDPLPPQRHWFVEAAVPLRP